MFGLRAGAPVGHVRRRYKALARRWHPDRHSREAGHQAEAASRMREINSAYRCLANHLAGQAGRPTAGAGFLEGSPGVASPSGPLSRQELDRLVQAIGSAGPIDWLLDGFDRVGGALWRLLVGLCLLASIARLSFLVGGRGAASALQDPTFFLSVSLLALLLVREVKASGAFHRQ